MTTPLTPSGIADLPRAITPSLLDGYPAAVASGPNFAMPDQVLRWVWPTGQPADQTANNLVIRHYQAVNDALNDQSYVPLLTNPQFWCRGYMDGVAANMMAWVPLMAARPELIKMIMSESGDLANVAQRIHGFWLAQRQQGAGLDLVDQLAALAPGLCSGSNELAHR
jgi:yecA family protein